MGQEKCNIADDQDCRVSRAVYETDCLNCLDQTGKRLYYLETTGRTIHSRQREHQDSVRQKQTSNAMYKHHQTGHRGLAPRFQTKVKHGRSRYNLDRFLAESIDIENARGDTNVNLLNQKSKLGHLPLPTLSVWTHR